MLKLFNIVFLHEHYILLINNHYLSNSNIVENLLLLNILYKLYSMIKTKDYENINIFQFTYKE